MAKSLPGSAVISFSPKGTLRYTCFSGSFTLEAAVVLPFAACFFVSILFFFRVLQVQLEVQKALDDTGRWIAVSLQEVSETESAAEKAIAGAVFVKELVGRKAVKTYVRGGIAGISLAGSDFSGTEVHLKAAYQIRFPIRLLGLLRVELIQRSDCRKWTGWIREPGTAEGEVWVYVAETGRVYHLTENCTHLKLSVQQTGIGAVSAMRNESGARYKRCALCADDRSGQGQVYITRQGDRYHYNLNCSGIKRTIFRIQIGRAHV